MISAFLLLKDIQDALSRALAEFPFREPPGAANGQQAPSWRRPRAYVGQMPPKREGVLPDGTEQGRDLPFALVTIPKAEVTGEQPREYKVDVGVVYGVYSGERDNEAVAEEALNLGEAIVAAIACRRLWADSHYKMVLPVSLVIGTGKAQDIYAHGWEYVGPYGGGVVTAQFYAAFPAAEPPRNIVDAGEPAHPIYKNKEL